MPWELMLSAVLIGALGAGHCFAMCGGIIGTLSLSQRSDTTIKQQWLFSLSYNLGRISSYTLIGLFAGFVGHYAAAFFSTITSLPILRLLAGVMLVLMGFYLGGWWRILVVLEKMGARLWQHIEPLGRRFLPIRSLSGALCVGAVWGWLPCGLVYSTLAVALAQRTPWHSALVMLCFGLGTLPALVLAGVAGAQLKKILRSSWMRNTTGVLIIGFGVWTIALALYHYVGAEKHAHHTVAPKSMADEIPASHQHSH